MKLSNSFRNRLFFVSFRTPPQLVTSACLFVLRMLSNIWINFQVWIDKQVRQIEVEFEGIQWYYRFRHHSNLLSRRFYKGRYLPSIKYLFNEAKASLVGLLIESLVWSECKKQIFFLTIFVKMCEKSSCQNTWVRVILQMCCKISVFCTVLYSISREYWLLYNLNT